MAPYSYADSRVSGDTGAGGICPLAYTAQFGNGVTASLSFEDGGAGAGGRGKLISDMAMVEWTLGGTAVNNRGFIAPDVVTALRVEQAWGYAQRAAALHDASGGYYGAANSVLNGHPPDKWGGAVTAGFTLNDILGMKGDTFAMQGCYSVGAAGYCTRATGPFQVYSNNNNAGWGWVSEGIYDTGTNVELTTVWSINGALQHFWNPKWRTSLYGGYVQVDYNGNATTIINSHLPGAAGTTPCGVPVAGAVQPPLTVSAAGGNSCSPNFSWWQVGSRTQWNPHPDLDIGVDVLWTHLNTAYKGPGVVAASGARPAAAINIDDQDVLSVFFRIQRNFLP